MERSRVPSIRNVAKEADTSLRNHYPEKHSQIIAVFKCKTVSEALTESDEVATGAVKTALLATLAILLPDMRKKLQGLTRTPLGETKEDVNSYLEVVIKSGVATDARREMLYVLGNTGIGKTSLTETYKAFVEKPDKTPESFLTQDHPQLLKTRIAEVHKDAMLPQIHNRTVCVGGTLRKEKMGENIVLVRIDNNPDEESQREREIDKCLLKIIDFGGHQVISISETASYKISSGIYKLFQTLPP